jgi:hypothetical protein
MNKLNINVNKDDQNINDFLFCWSELGFRPSKTTVYNNFDTQFFLDFFSESFSNTTVQKDIIPYDSDNIVNERFFTQIDENIWLTFVIFDSVSDNSFVGEVSFYFDNKVSEKVDSIILDIEPFSTNDEQSEQKLDKNLFTLSLNPNGFDMYPLIVDTVDLDNIDSYYNDSVMKQINKLSKKITNNKKGLSIIYGERGVGKTSIISHLSSKIEKNFLFLPTTLFDTSVNTPDFRNFLKKNPNSILVLDDCEIYFSDLYSKSNIFTNNILQLVDGLDSDELSLNLILILNCDREDDIDSHLLDSNNLLDVISVDYLRKNKISELCKLINKDKKFKSPTKLVDVLKNRYKSYNESEIGF